MTSGTVRSLIDRWRAEAALLGGYAADQAAAACERHATELEQAMADAAGELISIQQAVAESGYSERRIRELVSEGAIENAGRRGAPRFRRGDLPRRVGKRETRGYDAAADAARILGVR